MFARVTDTGTDDCATQDRGRQFTAVCQRSTCAP